MSSVSSYGLVMQTKDTIPSPPPDDVAECESCGRVSDSVAPCSVTYDAMADGPGCEVTEELLLCGGCR